MRLNRRGFDLHGDPRGGLDLKRSADGPTNPEIKALWKLGVIDLLKPVVLSIFEHALPYFVGFPPDDAVSMHGCFTGEKRDMRPSHDYGNSPLPEFVGNGIGSRDLNGGPCYPHEIIGIGDVEGRPVFVGDAHLVIQGGERC